MDYIQGERLGTFDKNDFIEFQKLCYTFIVSSCFFKDISHGDLHTGNIIFIKNTTRDKPTHTYKIGIIDYGICLKLNIAEQDLIANLMRVSLQNDKQSVILYLLNFIMNNDENNDESCSHCCPVH
jgi:predicted unusual protein kinase regulating ubiquinone biosynthesis (AarF/ABC1/UbiB family)